MTDLDALIAKLDVAPEGSRELDGKIDAIVRQRITHPKLPIGYTMEDQGDERRNRLLAQAGALMRNRGPAPPYTTSLDAALTLVPKGWSWLVMDSSKGIAAQMTPREGGNHQTCKASTPAIALCIVALKARRAQEEA